MNILDPPCTLLHDIMVTELPTIRCSRIDATAIFLPQTPLSIQADGQLVSGNMRLAAHSSQSYDIHLTLQTQSAPVATVATDGGMEVTPTEALQSSSGVFDLKDPYYRQLRTPYIAAE